MIEIDLLPPELKKKKASFAQFNFDISKIDINNIPVVPIIIGITAIILILEFIIISIGIVANIQLTNLSKRYTGLTPQIKESKALKEQVVYINQISKAIDDLMSQRYSWGIKLKALNNCMIPGIWLSEMDYNEKPFPATTALKKIDTKKVGSGNKGLLTGVLVFSGYASGPGEHGATVIGKFIKSLQDNPEFAAGFSSIELAGTKSDKVDKQDVMSFKINCYFE